ncbi:MAG: DUF4268 domain-containing protein [Polyangia bacterium]
MEAAEARIEKVLDGNQQFLVPHYQRPYSWQEAQWKTLWRDLVELIDETDPKPHFIGSIVTSAARSIPEGVEKRLLIDGQQRLTTLLVLLALIRDRARETGLPKLADRIHDLITNRHEEGNEHFKLLPTQGEDPTDSDRDAFVRIVRGEPPASPDGIAAAYAYFASKLRRADAPDLDVLFRTLVGKLTLVSIILNEKDNPHRIFESLNGKGRPLSQADLIRNYFFMRMDPREHDAVYRELWRPMQKRLGEDLLASFVRHYLMRAGEVVREMDVYVSLKAQVDEDPRRKPIDHLKELVRFAGYYEALVRPDKITEPKIRARLNRLNRLEVTVAYPFLLVVMADHATGARTSDEVVEVLDVLENFLIRRFVSGVPTHGLNKVFPTLHGNACKGEVYVPEVRRLLSMNARGYPRDSTFREGLASARLYGSGERREKTKLILERLEAAAGHKERVDPAPLTIEHVMPQTITDEWRTQLGSSWEDDHEELLHTLGNLTLTSYNSELGNAPYAEKRARLAESHLELNKYFEGVEQWNAAAIDSRAEALVAQALEIWPYFGAARADEDEEPAAASEQVTGSSPTLLRMRGVETIVRSWVDVAVATVEGTIAIGDDEFRRVVDELPKFVNTDATAFRRSSRLRRLSNSAYLETNLSARGIHRLCVQAIQAAGITAEDWVVTYDGSGGTATSAAPRSAKDHAYQTFFQLLIDDLREKHQFTNARAAQPQSWYSFTSGVPGFNYSFNFLSAGRIRVELYIDHRDQATNKALFDRLAIEREAIDIEFGVPLTWERLDEKQASRVAFYSIGSITDATEKLAEHLRWAVDRLLRFKAVFAGKLKKLSPRSVVASDGEPTKA